MQALRSPAVSSVVLDVLRQNMSDAIELLDERGWTPSSRSATDRMTVAHALKAASQREFEVYLNREIVRRRGVADSWWKQPGRTYNEVRESLIRYHPTEHDLVALGGPDWQVAFFVLTSAGLLPASAVSAMNDLREPVSWRAACEHAINTADDMGLPVAIADAFADQPDGDPAGTWCAARGATWATILAHSLAVQDTFDFYDYQTLMEPYRRVAVPILSRREELLPGTAETATLFSVFADHARVLGVSTDGREAVTRIEIANHARHERLLNSFGQTEFSAF